MQFDETQKAGCSEAEFYLKNMLWNRREMGTDTRDILIDLV